VFHSSILRHLALALLLFLGSFAASFAQTLVPQEQTIADYMVNSPDQGRPYMVLDPIIEAVARARAKDMAVRNYFSHVNPDGVAANYLLAQAGYQLPAWWGTDPTANYVESIAAGYASASSTWTAWMNSPDHKVHILGQNSFFATETHYGVGYYYDPNSTYKYYWVIITAPPQPIAIITPAPSAQVTTASVAVAGTTDPGADAASVQFCVANASGTSAYQPATGATSWSGTADGFAPGPNLLIAQSLDGSGNVLATATCAFTYVVEGTLSVAVSGSGSVTSAFAGVTTQPVGESVTLRASPASGSVFTGWSGSVVSGSASLTFVMQDGMSLQANFEPNPFPPVSGAYYGILTAGSGAQTGIAGLTVSSAGLVTGRIQLSGTVWTFTGALDPSGAATIAIPQTGQAPVTLTVQADLTGGSGQITGALSDGADTFGFSASQSTFNAAANAAPQAGRYTLVLSPNPAATGTSVPQGNGYAAIVVDAGGDARVAGCLADGTPYVLSGHVANDGTLALYGVPQGARAGSSLNGLLTFRSTDVSDLDGTLTWTRIPDSHDLYYPAGFVTQLPAVGSLFVRPAAGFRPVDVTPGLATAGFGGGNLPQTINVPMMISQADRVAMVTPGQPRVSVGINPYSGVVTGSFVMPDGNLRRSVGGVVLQKQESAFGFFRGINQCGYFSLIPESQVSTD